MLMGEKRNKSGLLFIQLAATGDKSKWEGKRLALREDKRQKAKTWQGSE
jgi:hypothetical protein